MKVRILITVTLLVSFLSAVCASAQLQRETPANVTVANNQWAIDFTAMHTDYRETVTSGRVLDTEIGEHYGWQTSFSVQQPWLFPRLYLNGTLRQSYGTLTHSEANPVNDLIPTLGSTRDLDLRTGVGVGIGNHVQITPYIGGGRHYWERQLTGQGGYLENYQHDYAGGGILAQFSPARQIVFSGYGFLGMTFNSQLTSQYNIAISCASAFGCTVFHRDYNFPLGAEPMSMVGTSADIALTPRWHANVGADLNSFRYGRSAPILIPGGSVLEPDSRSSLLTVKAGIGYAF